MTDQLRTELRQPKPSDFTVDEQIGALEYVLKIIDRCLGHSAHDTYRAYALGSRILGFRFEQHPSLYRDARLYGAVMTVQMHPNLIRQGDKIGYVYFAAESTGELLKIGYSTNPQRRLRTLEATTGKTLTLLHQQDGFMLNEHHLHLEARPAWMGGEWFNLPLLLEMPAFSHLRRTA